MRNSSFDRLREPYPDLHAHLCHAEQCSESDPRASLASVRMFGEDLAKMLAAQNSIADRGMKQGARIHALKGKKVIPTHVARELKTIATLGNEALHETASRADCSKRALDSAQVVVAWMIRAEASQPAIGAHPQRVGRAPSPSGAWAIRPYPHYVDRRAEFLTENIIAIGWPTTGSLAGLDKVALLKILRLIYPDREHRWSQDCNTLLKFRSAIAVADLVIMVPYTSDDRKVAIAQVIGEYRFQRLLANNEDGYAHQHQVRWLEERLDRSELPASIQLCLNWRGIIREVNKSALVTFCHDRNLL